MLQLIKEMAVIHTKKRHLKSNVLSSGTAESVAKHLPPTIKIPHCFSHLTENMAIGHSIDVDTDFFTDTQIFYVNPV